MTSKISTLFLVFITTFCLGQTTLPTEWDFATTPATLPTGWSTNTSASYSSGLLDNSGGTSRAGKLQSQNHHFTIDFFDEPGFVEYNLRAYSSNGANFSGTFSVQESENGSSWTTLHQFGSNDFGNAWSNYVDTPDVDTRHIRFFFSTKVSGINVGLDDVEIGEFIPVTQEINAVFDGNDVPSSTSIQFSGEVSSTEELKIGIENLGSGGTLMLGAINFSGTAASDYALGSAPTSINPLSSDTIVIEFTPSTSGSRVAEVSIGNNDANENPYLITLDGIGGSTATEPTSNPSSVTTSTLKTYRVKSSFNSVTADGYLVAMSKNEPMSWNPADGEEYEVGQGVSNGKVISVGTSNTIWIKEATADDTFHIRTFAYNGSGAYINYRTSDPLEDSILTPLASMQSNNYYSGVDNLASTFISDLHDVINPHMVRFYSNYGPDMIPPLVARDTINGDEVVTGVYSGEEAVYSPPFGWPETGMNREHTFPASWMPSSGNSGTPEYQDFHHLFPTISTANGQRSNHPLGTVSNVTNSYGAGKVGTNNQGNTVYEPRDGQKGDAARAIFYMQTAYHDPQGGDSWALDNLNSNGPNQKTKVLLKWHYEDPATGFEHARNDYLDSLQQNRNPFVDSAHWVCYIDFKTMTYINEPDSECLARTTTIVPDTVPTDTTDSTIGMHEIESVDWLHYPNPASEQLYLGTNNGGELKVRMSDVLGKAVFEEKLVRNSWIDIRRLQPGLYLVELTQEGQRYSFKLMKN